MATLTIRKIPPVVATAIRKRAVHNHYSLNKAAVSILEEAVGIKPGKKTALFHDLDWMCGAWDNHQAKTMEKSITAGRKIDKELWK